MPEITVKDFIEAMRKNGYEQARNGAYINYEEREDGTKVVLSACAYGQAALNLGIDPEDIWLVTVVDFAVPFPDIVSMNDDEGYSLQEIADAVEKWATENSALDISMYAPV